MIIVRDVTELLNQITVVQALKNNLDEIAWIHSHKVRAPLAKILGLVDLIKNKYLFEKQGQRLLDYLFESASEFDRIIKDIVGRSEQIKIIQKKSPATVLRPPFLKRPQRYTEAVNKTN